MHNNEACQMMTRCIDEIKMQRAEIERLRPKAQAYDLIAKILSLLPQHSIGMGEDLVYTLEKRKRELEQATKPGNLAGTAQSSTAEG